MCRDGVGWLVSSGREGGWLVLEGKGVGFRWRCGSGWRGGEGWCGCYWKSRMCE